MYSLECADDAKWLLVYLLFQLPDLVHQLGTLYQLMESRVRTFQKLSHLHGKLILLVTQVSKSDGFGLRPGCDSGEINEELPK